MPQPRINPIEMDQLRRVALQKLQQYSRSDQPVRECYRFRNDYFAGIRFEAGSISFLWDATTSQGHVARGERVLETIHGIDDGQRRRAA